MMMGNLSTHASALPGIGQTGGYLSHLVAHSDDALVVFESVGAAACFAVALQAWDERSAQTTTQANKQANEQKRKAKRGGLHHEPCWLHTGRAFTLCMRGVTPHAGRFAPIRAAPARTAPGRASAAAEY